MKTAKCRHGQKGFDLIDLHTGFSIKNLQTYVYHKWRY